MRNVLSAAATVDTNLRLSGRFSGAHPGSIFRQTYGTYEIRRSSITQYTDKEGAIQDLFYGAETFSDRNTIEFYDLAFVVDPPNPNFRSHVMHELGHAFNGAVVATTDSNPYGDLTVAISESGELSVFGQRARMAEYP